MARKPNLNHLACKLRFPHSLTSKAGCIYKANTQVLLKIFGNALFGLCFKGFCARGYNISQNMVEKKILSITDKHKVREMPSIDSPPSLLTCFSGFASTGGTWNLAIITCGKSEVGLFQSGTSYEKDTKELELTRSFFAWQKKKTFLGVRICSTKQKGHSLTLSVGSWLLKNEHFFPRM